MATVPAGAKIMMPAEYNRGPRAWGHA